MLRSQQLRTLAGLLALSCAQCLPWGGLVGFSCFQSFQALVQYSALVFCVFCFVFFFLLLWRISTTSLTVELYSGHRALTTNHLGSDFGVCWLCVWINSPLPNQHTFGVLGQVWASGAIKDKKCFGLRKMSGS